MLLALYQAGHEACRCPRRWELLVFGNRGSYSLGLKLICAVRNCLLFVALQASLGPILSLVAATASMPGCWL